jgi:hypothetical protein
LQQVKAHPEASLYYPGAQVVWPFGGGEERNVIDGGVNGAFAGAILRTNVSSESIYAWYKNWMAAHGWQSSPTIRATTQISVEGYARGDRERFSIAIDDPAELGRTLGRPIPAGPGTVYEISYMILPAVSS